MEEDGRGHFVEARRYATGRGPPRALPGVACEGTFAERWIIRGPAREGRPFTLCTRHADLLWLLGRPSLEGDPALRSWVAQHAPDLARDPAGPAER